MHIGPSEIYVCVSQVCTAQAVYLFRMYARRRTYNVSMPWTPGYGDVPSRVKQP